MDIDLIEEEPQTALTVTARAALALSSEKTRQDLQALVAKSANIREVKNAAGRDEAHGAAMALVRARTTITKTGKAAREDAAAFQKAVIAEERSLLAITEAEEQRLIGLRDAWDSARAAEKAEAERIERARVEGIHLRIADIRECAILAAQARTSEMVQSLIDKLDGTELAGFAEFANEAAAVKATSLERMQKILADKLAEEVERARIKAEQEAEAVRLAEERAELERQRQEAAERERIAAQERAEQEAKARAARDAEEAAAKAVRDAEAKRLADERAAFEAEQAKARAAAQAEADRLAQERAEFQAEIDRRAAEAKALEVPPAEPSDAGLAVTEIFNQDDGSEDLDGPPCPSDSDLIACAAAAVAQRFGLTYSDAINRLAGIQDWQVESFA